MQCNTSNINIFVLSSFLSLLSKFYNTPITIFTLWWPLLLIFSLTTSLEKQIFIKVVEKKVTCMRLLVQQLFYLWPPLYRALLCIKERKNIMNKVGFGIKKHTISFWDFWDCKIWYTCLHALQTTFFLTLLKVWILLRALVLLKLHTASTFLKFKIL